MEYQDSSNFTESVHQGLEWIVGVFEKNDGVENGLKFLRVGWIISNFLIGIAGNLEFNRTFDSYYVLGGPSQNINITTNTPGIIQVHFVQLLEDYGGPSEFSFGLIHLKVPFDLENSTKNLKSLATDIYENPRDEFLFKDRNFLSIEFINVIIKEHRYIGGFSNVTNQLTYFYNSGENFDIYYNSKGQMANYKIDGCIKYGNMISTPKRNNLDISFGIIGLLEIPFDFTAKNTELNGSLLKFDREFCPGIHNLSNIIGIAPNRRFATLIKGGLWCQMHEFTCDQKCFPLTFVCDGNQECTNGLDETEFYCSHKSEYPRVLKSRKKRENFTKLAIILSITISCILFGIGIGITIFLLRRERKKATQKLSNKEIDEFLYGKEKARKLHLDSLELASDYQNIMNESDYQNIPYDRNQEIESGVIDIDYSSSLGSGQYGIVYKGIVLAKKSINRRSVDVAVKSIKEDADLNYIKAILSEIKIFQYLGSHPSIINFVGACTNNIKKGDVFIVLEFCHLGSLSDYIKDKDNLKLITHYIMMKWSLEIASGMEFLENKKVIHGDLAARNILLTSDRHAKITDFGLSRKLYNYECYAKNNETPLPWRWMALESLKNLEFSSKSDVWSYAVLLWEIFSFCQVPFSGMSWTSEFIHELENGMRLGKPKNSPNESYQILESCWANNPADRPNFSDIKLEIEEYFI